MPTDDKRAEIFGIHLKKRGRDPAKFDIKKLVDVSTDFVGAEIESIIEEALFNAFDLDQDLSTDYILTLPLALNALSVQ